MSIVKPVPVMISRLDHKLLEHILNQFQDKAFTKAEFIVQARSQQVNLDLAQKFLLEMYFEGKIESITWNKFQLVSDSNVSGS